MFTAFYNIMLMDTSVEVGFAALQEYFRRVIAVPWVFDLGPSDFYETLQGSPYEVAKRFVDFVSAVNNAPAPPPPFVPKIVPKMEHTWTLDVESFPALVVRESSNELALYPFDELVNELESTDWKRSPSLWSDFEFPVEPPPPPPARDVVMRGQRPIPQTSGITCAMYYEHVQASKPSAPIVPTISRYHANRHMIRKLSDPLIVSDHWSNIVSDYEEEGVAVPHAEFAESSSNESSPPGYNKKNSRFANKVNLDFASTTTDGPLLEEAIRRARSERLSAADVFVEPQARFRSEGRVVRGTSPSTGPVLADRPVAVQYAISSILKAMGSDDFVDVLRRYHSCFGAERWSTIVESIKSQAGMSRKLKLVENLTKGQLHESWRSLVEDQDPLFITFFHAVVSFGDCVRIDDVFDWEKNSKINSKKIFNIQGAAQQRLNSPAVLAQATRYSAYITCCTGSNTVNPQSDTLFCGVGNRIEGEWWVDTFGINCYNTFNKIAYHPRVLPVTRVCNFFLDRRKRPVKSDSVPSVFESVLVTIKKSFYDFARKFHSLIRRIPWLLNLGVLLSLVVALKILGANWAFYLPLIPMAFSAFSPAEGELCGGVDLYGTFKSIVKCFTKAMEASAAIRDQMNGPRDENGMPTVDALEVYNERKAVHNASITTQASLPGLYSFAILSVLTSRVPLVYRLMNFTKFQQGIDSFIDGASTSVQSLLDLFTKSMRWKRILICGELDHKVQNWLNEAYAFRSAVARCKKDIDVELIQQYDVVVGCGENCRALYNSNTPSWRVINMELTALLQLAVVFPAFTSPGAVRSEPLGIMFKGLPGVGKSTILARFTEQLARAVYRDKPGQPKTPLGNLVYQKGTSDYWDGYANQPICGFDDFSQKIPVPGAQDDELTIAIKAINQWPFPLNMAALPLKGRFYFRSSFCVGTTNVNNIEPFKKVICELGALQRRFPFQYEITLKPGAVVTPTCDPDKTWYFTPTAIFVTHKPPPGKPISYNEMLELVIAEHWRRQIFFEERRQHTTSAVDRDADKIDLIRDKVYKEKGYVWYSPTNTYHLPGVNPIEFPEDKEEEVVEQVPIQTQGAVFSAVVPTLTGYGNYAGYAVGAGVVSAMSVGLGSVISNNIGVVNHTCEQAGSSLARGVLSGLADSVNNFVKANYHNIMAAIAAFSVVLMAIWIGGPCLSGWMSSKKDDSTVVAQAAPVDEVVTKIQKNILPIFCGDKRVGFGLALDDSSLVVPYHYITEAQRINKFLHFVDDIGTTVRLLNIVGGNPQTDHVCLRVKTRRASIRHFIGSCPTDTLCHFISPESIRSTKTRGASLERYPHAEPSQRLIFAHTLVTAVGDCGSILVSTDEKNRQRLVGMHVAGSNSGIRHGFFTPLLHYADITLQSDVETFHGHELLGRLDQPLHNNGNTGIVATTYPDLFGPVSTAPAVRRPFKDGDTQVCPMAKAISSSKHDHPVLDSHVPLVARIVVNEIFSSFDKERLCTYDWAQAVAGVPGEAYINGINRGSSPGYPECLKHHNSKSIFGKDGAYVLDSPEALRVLGNAAGVEKLYLEGVRCCVFSDNFKDEVRPLSKVSSGDTRIISGSSIEFTLVVRRYFMGFASEFMSHRLQHGGMVGMNPYSSESAWVFDRLRARNKDGLAFAGDFKGFDKRQHPGIMKAIWDSICANMPNCDKNTKKLFDTIGEETYNATHLGGDCYKRDTLYRTDGSLPSGHPLTSVLNSIYNMVVFRLAWVDQKGMSKVAEFRDEVDLFVYGDDNACAPSDRHIDFNFMSLKKFSPKINMIYTSESKDDVDYSLKPAAQCGFLKRKFELQGDWVYALLELDSIKEMFNWRKRATSEREHTAAIARAALMEVSAYPQTVFDEYFNKIEVLCQRFQLASPSLGLPADMARDYWREVYRGHKPVWSHSGEIASDQGFEGLKVLK
jgi:hypothetical protein